MSKPHWKKPTAPVAERAVDLPKTTAEKWLIEAIAFHEKFRRTFELAKECALKAGIFFNHAQTACAHGEWLPLIEKFEGVISRTTIYRYMSFANEVFEWVKAEHPKLAGDDKMIAAAQKLVLRSPKGYIALCRQLELMRKFGEYDEVKYRMKKLGTKQMEFEFADLAMSIDHLTHLGDAHYNFKFPEGQDQAEFIEQVETKLETALKRVRAMKHKSTVTNV
jgi:hypothetical protein